MAPNAETTRRWRSYRSQITGEHYGHVAASKQKEMLLSSLSECTRSCWWRRLHRAPGGAGRTRGGGDALAAKAQKEAIAISQPASRRRCRCRLNESVRGAAGGAAAHTTVGGAGNATASRRRCRWRLGESVRGAGNAAGSGHEEVQIPGWIQRSQLDKMPRREGDWTCRR